MCQSHMLLLLRIGESVAVTTLGVDSPLTGPFSSILSFFSLVQGT